MGLILNIRFILSFLHNIGTNDYAVFILEIQTAREDVDMLKQQLEAEILMRRKMASEIESSNNRPKGDNSDNALIILSALLEIKDEVQTRDAAIQFNHLLLVSGIICLLKIAAAIELMLERYLFSCM